MAELINVAQERIDALQASVNGRHIRFDAPEWRARMDNTLFNGAGVHLQRELEHVLAEVIKVQVAPRDFLRAFRLNTSVPAGRALVRLAVAVVIEPIAVFRQWQHLVGAGRERPIHTDFQT
jgi:hypothetical protein